jgi:putative PIN family toxin of toxin-antitoxin system
MKIVLDNNIFISAAFWRGKPYDVFERAVLRQDTVFVTDDILIEIENTLRKPKFTAIYSLDQINRAVANIKKLCQKVIPYPHHQVVGVCRDKDDNVYLECALASNADCIITGYKDLLDLNEYNGIKIITAKEYLEIVNP